jgi:hypothetical protein
VLVDGCRGEPREREQNRALWPFLGHLKRWAIAWPSLSSEGQTPILQMSAGQQSGGKQVLQPGLGGLFCQPVPKLHIIAVKLLRFPKRKSLFEGKGRLVFIDFL